MFADLWQDLRYGARMLRTHPDSTLIAVLALGTGALEAGATFCQATSARPCG